MMLSVIQYWFDHGAQYGSEDDLYDGARIAMSRRCWYFLQVHTSLDD